MKVEIQRSGDTLTIINEDEDYPVYAGVAAEHDPETDADDEILTVICIDPESSGTFAFPDDVSVSLSDDEDDFVDFDEDEFDEAA